MKGASNFAMSAFGSSPRMSDCWVVALCQIGFAKSGIFTQSIMRTITCASGNASSSRKGSGVTGKDQQETQWEMLLTWTMSSTETQTCEFQLT